MEKQAPILITGGTGVVGRALVDCLHNQGFTHVTALGSKDGDLTDKKTTYDLFNKIQPQYVFHLAGHVFGIMGNMLNQESSFLNNLLINTHVIEACRRTGVKKVTAMGTGAIYPFPMPSNPLKEDTIWMGEPHGSERGYAHAKRAMLSQLDVYKESCDMDYAFVVSCNLYGPHDRFNIETGHVIPALIRKFYEAKQNSGKVSVWGDGSAQRDFMYSIDAAQALLTIMENVTGAVNIGSQKVYKIRDIVDILAEHTGMEDYVTWDSTKPNGQPFRAYDLTRLKKTGFTCRYSLADSLKETYDWYTKNVHQIRD